MGHSNVQSPPGLSREQYPGIPGHIPGICSSLPGSCSIHRGTSVQVPSALIQENIFKYLNIYALYYYRVDKYTSYRVAKILH